MKKIIAIILFTGLAVVASAQHGRTFHRSHVRTRVGIGIGIGSGYGYYGGPRYYDPFYSYPYGYYNYNQPTKLDLEIQDIRNDYQDRIWSVKHDKSLSGHERRSMVRNLKAQREKAIYDARRNYYKRY